MQSPDITPTQDTILILKKDTYFFPHYQGSVFAPFGAPQPSLRYLAYKVLHLLHLPGAHLFWGSWKLSLPFFEIIYVTRWLQ